MPRRYNPKQTSRRVATLAGRNLPNKKVPRILRIIIASALVQAKPKIKIKLPKPKKPKSKT